MKYRHSTPWRVVPEEGPPLIISTRDPGYIAQCFDDDGNGRVNAEFIVKAANAYPHVTDFMRRLEVRLEEMPDKVTAEWLLGELNKDMCYLRELIQR